MNIAIIFAGGVGSRMNSKSQPKQFLELHSKPIIIYTLEVFEQHDEIDAIIISCIEEWIGYLENLLLKFNIKKVVKIVPGGTTGQESIYNGIKAASSIFPKNSITLIHDGVRPIINRELISNNIESVKKYGSAITVTPAKETIIMLNEESIISSITDRTISFTAKAPQSFYLFDLLEAHETARKENINSFIDSCTMMQHYGKKLMVVEGDPTNIKITNPIDFYLFRAIIEARENSQIFGL